MVNVDWSSDSSSVDWLCGGRLLNLWGSLRDWREIIDHGGNRRRSLCLRVLSRRAGGMFLAKQRAKHRAALGLLICQCAIGMVVAFLFVGGNYGSGGCMNLSAGSY